VKINHFLKSLDVFLSKKNHMKTNSNGVGDVQVITYWNKNVHGVIRQIVKKWK
jgi:hypothetical protein